MPWCVMAVGPNGGSRNTRYPASARWIESPCRPPTMPPATPGNHDTAGALSGNPQTAIGIHQGLEDVPFPSSQGTLPYSEEFCSGLLGGWHVVAQIQMPKAFFPEGDIAISRLDEQAMAASRWRGVIPRLKALLVFLGDDAAPRVGGIHVEGGPGDVPPNVRPRLCQSTVFSL